MDVVQENTFLNEVGLQMKKNKRFQTWRNRWVIIIAMALSFFVYMLAGVIGYVHVRRLAGSGKGVQRLGTQSDATDASF